MAPPVFKTGLAGNTLAGRFDSFPPPPILLTFEHRSEDRVAVAPADFAPLPMP